MAFDGPLKSEAIGWSWRKGWLPQAQPHGRRFHRTKKIILGLAICSILAFFIGFFAYVHKVKSYGIYGEVQAEGIVTLTGGSQRIDEALQLLQQGRAKRMLISGVNELTTREEIARLNPSYANLFTCCVDLDYMARNTIGNAIQARHWANVNSFESLIVVTSNYHMPRTLLELQHAMPHSQKIPYAVSAGSIDAEGWWKDGVTLRLLMGEYIKYLIAWGRTQIERDPERDSTARLLGKPVKNIVEPQSK